MVMEWSDLMNEIEKSEMRCEDESNDTRGEKVCEMKQIYEMSEMEWRC